MDPLEAISPIDGRYRRYTAPLAGYFSESALMSYRIKVEGEYLIALSEHSQIGVKPFSDGEKILIRSLSNLSVEQARIIKAIETQGYKDIRATNHDVKAVEYFMRDQLQGTSLEDCVEWIHFALTSEDVNNIAYALMLRDSINEVIFPVAHELHDEIGYIADNYGNIPMLARTHGQPASPTTFGKEFKVFSERMGRQLRQLEEAEILVKLNGATGNYNAHFVAYPQINWRRFTDDFVERLNELDKSDFIKLKPNFVTTQIEPHDSYVELFDNLARLNRVILDFDLDVWRYISDGWLVQKPVDGEVGSSTMPHKVNPINFESSEGNLGLANALLGHFSNKLQVSRLQRDLSDSTVQRSIGAAFGYSLIGYKTALKGLGKISVNEEKVIWDLENHPEVISEAIQTVLRREGVAMPYERLKALTRGRKVTMDDFRRFIDDLDISDEVKVELRGITPTNYTGIADLLVENN